MNKKMIIIVSLLVIGLGGFVAVKHLYSSHSHSHSSENLPNLSLNNGSLWQADDHTRNSMRRIEKIVNANAGLNDVVQYNQLGNAINSELETLIKGCTMKGPDHDQLHIYLSMLIPKVNSIRETSDLNAAKTELNEVTKLTSEFFHYFK